MLTPPPSPPSPEIVTPIVLHLLRRRDKNHIYISDLLDDFEERKHSQQEKCALDLNDVILFRIITSKKAVKASDLYQEWCSDGRLLYH